MIGTYESTVCDSDNIYRILRDFKYHKFAKTGDDVIKGLGFE